MCFVGGVIVNNILLWFRKHKNIVKSVIIVFIILVLFVALSSMLWVMVSVIKDCDIKEGFMGCAGYMEEKDKPEFIKLIGLGISGIIATFGVVGLLRRAASVDEQNKLTEKGHVHERFKAATEHLSNEKSVSSRIAAFNEFYHIAEIELDLRKTIFDILCAHLRQTTKHTDYKPEERELEDGNKEIKPTEEVQSLLDVLFKPTNEYILIFEDLEVNLAEVNLQGADLEGAYLEGAKMQKANLQNAKMQGANLRYANLQNAKMQGANLRYANLEEADLRYVNLQDANLEDAKMRYAKMQDAKMQEADLEGADLRYANLQDAKMQNANLRYANLEDAHLQGAKLQKTNLLKADLQNANLRYANLQGANLQNANLQGANLQGAQRHKSIEMPDGWKDIVVKDNDGKTGLVIMNDKKEVIENL